MKNQPLVSVIIPTHNREKILPKTIDSVMDQTYQNWELIIVDDRSTDNTRELVKNYMKKDRRVRYIKNKRKKGPGGARNQGIIKSNGKYITFLDSDDEWKKNHIKESVYYCEKENLMALSSLITKRRKGALKDLTGIDRCMKSLNPQRIGNLYKFDKRLFEYLLFNFTQIFHLDTLCINKRLIDRIGMFNEDLWTGQDNDFCFRIIINGYFVFLNKRHAIWNEGEDNVNAVSNEKEKLKLVRKKLWYRSKLLYCKILRKTIKENFDHLNKNKMLKKVKKTKSEVYWWRGYAYRKENKVKALYYYLNSLLLEYNNNKLECIKKLFIPGYYKEHKK